MQKDFFLEQRTVKNILNTIIKGDCVEELKKIPSNIIDFIFAVQSSLICESGNKQLKISV